MNQTPASHFPKLSYEINKDVIGFRVKISVTSLIIGYIDDYFYVTHKHIVNIIVCIYIL